jgi:hypothetical protein
MIFKRFARTGNKATERNRKLPLHSAVGRIHPFAEPPKASETCNYIAIIDGIEAPIYREVLQSERAELYATADRSTKVREDYRSGLFSAGRPGIIATSE